MEDNVIRVGDLVMVVGVCCDEQYLGKVFTVYAKGWKHTSCKTCRKRYGKPSSMLRAHDDDAVWPDRFLKKITPPPESVFDTERQDEEITA